MKRIPPEELIELEQHRKRVERRRIVRAKLLGAQKAERDRVRAQLRSGAASYIRFSDNRVVIELPPEFSFERNYEETQRAINSLRETVLVARDRVIVDFQHVEFVGVAAALSLTSEIIRCRSTSIGSRDGAVSGTYPKSKTVHKILVDMGFFRALELDPHWEGTEELPKNIYVGMKPFLKADPAMIQSFSEVFLGAFPHLTPVARQRLQGV